MMAVSISFTTRMGRASLDVGGLFRIVLDAKAVLLIPPQVMDLQVRLMLCAHMKEAGQRGVAATS